MLFFFFSSRRRHTRLQGDWSSDVCSSDLYKEAALGAGFRVTTILEAVAWGDVVFLLIPDEEQPQVFREHIGPYLRPHRSEEHTSELQSPCNLVCRLLLEKKKKKIYI